MQHGKFGKDAARKLREFDASVEDAKREANYIIITAGTKKKRKRTLPVPETKVKKKKEPKEQKEDVPVDKTPFGSRLGWAFTDFKMTSKLQEYIDSDLVQYIVRGEEVCPKTGKLHYQGFVWFKTNQRMSALQKLVGHKCYCQPMYKKSTPAANEKYCKKDGKFEKWGDMPVTGRSNDLIPLSQACNKADGNVEAVYDAFPELYIKHHSAVDKIIRMKVKNPGSGEAPFVGIIWGAPRTGKSSWADYKFGGDHVYHLKASQYESKFWDGYKGEKVLVIEFDAGTWMEHKILVGLLDGSAQRVNVKYGGGWAKWKWVYLISNKEPSTWYRQFWTENPDQEVAFLGRVDQIVHVQSAMPHLAALGVKISKCVICYEV